MAYAYVQTPGNGTNRLFSVPFPFIVRAHVKVYLGYDVAAGTGTELVNGTGFIWLSDTQIQTTVAPALGTTLTVIRKTPNGSQLVVWAPGSPPTQADLNTAGLQSLYVVQEQADLTASAVTTATSAAAAANAAVAAVAAALPYQPIAAVANIPASPTAGQRIEISNTTGLGSFTPLAGKPTGFVGGTDVKARLVYGTPNAAAWNWIDYFPVDPDGRYATITAAANAQTTANNASTNAANAQTTANNASTNAANAQTTADSALAKTGRNRIINGAMAVDQRNNGAAQTLTAAAALAYTVDRWYAYCTGANVSAQRVVGASANRYRYRFTGAAGVTAIGFGQRIEAIDSADLAGTTVTLSVDLANSLLTSVTWTAYYANTADTFGTLASPTRTLIATGTFTVTSTVARFSAQVNIPVAATTGIEIVFSVGAQTSGTWTIGSVQLEPGSVATQHENRSYGLELELCQRYFQWAPFNIRFYPPVSGSSVQGPIVWPVVMRATPSVAALTADPTVPQFLQNVTVSSVIQQSASGASCLITAGGVIDTYAFGYRSAVSAEL